MAWQRRQRRRGTRRAFHISGICFCFAVLALPLISGCALSGATSASDAHGSALTSTNSAATATSSARSGVASTAAPSSASAAPAGTPTPASTYVPPAPPPDISAAAFILMDPDTGAVYASNNADQERAMASTTKIMTAMVALTFGKPDQRITVGADINALAGTGASLANLRQGDTLTLRHLLYGLLLPSGDDAAIVIADGVAGSQDNFIRLMNFEAALLGMRHTHYANVHGLDAPGHYTSARDLATLTRYALRNPTFAQIVATAHYGLPATGDHGTYIWDNTNLLLSSEYYPGITGVKTGFTGNAGACLVFSAARPYGRLLGVVLGEPDEQARFTDAAALLDWGFSLQLRSAVRRPVGFPAR